MNIVAKKWMIVIVLAVLSGIAPKAGAEKKLFDYKEMKLNNGLNIITLEDFSCPIVSVQVWYHVGSINEKPDRQGFAHMFEHMMFRGTNVLGPTDHFAFIRRVGGTSNGYTSFDRTVYLETLPAGQLELALWLEAERMAFLKIDQKSFDTERKVVEEERREHLNEPYGTVEEDLFTQIYKTCPYRWTPIGKISHLRASSVKELRQFWSEYYVPNNATLIIVGAVKHKDAQEFAKKYFGWIPRYPDPNKVTGCDDHGNMGRSITFTNIKAPAPATGVVYRTVSVRDKDSIILDIISQILGTGNSSRLYRELVAQKRLAVVAQSASWSLEKDGLFGAGAVLSPLAADTNNVLGIVEKHIEQLKKEAVTERELFKAKNQMLRDVVTDSLTDESKAKLLGTEAVDVGNVARVNEYLADIKKVTTKDILRVANKYFQPDRSLKVTIDRNITATIFGNTKDEENAPITGEVEKIEPEVGRGDLKKSSDFPQNAPFAKLTAAKISPKYNSAVLINGLKVLVVSNNEVPYVSVQLGLLNGGWSEKKPGIAAMAMKMLTKGTKKYSEGQLADELETYAINLSGNADMDTASVGAGCLSEYVEKTLSLMGEVVLEPNFPQNEFENLRKQVLTSLAISEQEPEHLAEKEYRRMLYGTGHPYSRTPTGETADVNALQIDDLKDWWTKFSRPDCAVLIFSGDIQADKAIKLAEKIFGKWRWAGEKPKADIAMPKQQEKTQIYLVDKPGSTQSQIRMGQLGITRKDSAYPVSRVVSDYFGWGFNSRLNKSIRVEKGLTYGVWGSYIANRFAGEFTIGTFSKTETTAQAVQGLISEIEKLKKDSPSEQELSNSQSYILGSFVRGRETPQQIAGDLWLIQSQGLGSDYMDKLLAAVRSSTQADCMNLVNRTVDAGKLLIVIVGDAEKVKAELEKIATVTIVKADKI